MLREWPAALQSRVTFSDDNSMSHFLKLEVARTGVGSAAPYNLVFVDGHHSFEYAFFDLLRSALYLRPGGVIVVDNVEQAGPADAVRMFMQRYRHWQLYAAPGFTPTPGGRPEFYNGSGGAVLLAPDGVEVGAMPFKVNLYDIKVDRISEVHIPVLNAAPKGSFTTTVNLYAVPSDLHITGKGMVNSVRTTTIELAGADNGEIVVRLPHAAMVQAVGHNVKSHVELEFSVLAPEGAEHVLIDPSRPIALA
jgi:hypothetical protein